MEQAPWVLKRSWGLGSPRELLIQRYRPALHPGGVERLRVELLAGVCQVALIERAPGRRGDDNPHRFAEGSYRTGEAVTAGRPPTLAAVPPILR